MKEICSRARLLLTANARI